MTHAPQIPEEQRSDGDHGFMASRAGTGNDRRDLGPEIETGPPGDVNPDEQGRFGDLRQSLTNHWMVQER